MASLTLGEMRAGTTYRMILTGHIRLLVTNDMTAASSSPAEAKYPPYGPLSD